MARLESAVKKIPIYLLCRIVNQAEITMSLLQTSRTNPRLSAYTQVFGNFDFNPTPMAPPGTKIIAYKKPNQLATWSKHGVSGWYIGPALDHYRWYKVFVTEKKSEIISDVVEFPPQNVRMPRVLSTDAATLAEQDLVELLKKQIPKAPFATINDTHNAASRSLVESFNIIPKAVE